MFHTYGKVGEFFSSGDMIDYPGFCVFLFGNIVLVSNQTDGYMHSTETWISPRSLGWVLVG